MYRFKTLARTPPHAVYVQPETAMPYEWTTSFDDLLARIAEHRKAHGFPMEKGWEEEVQEQICSTLKVSDWDEWCEDTSNPKVPRLVALGRQLWAELHAYALAFPERPHEKEVESALRWLEGWVARIPSAKCDCAYHWHKMGLDFDLSSRKGFYDSTVRVHDAIRSRLGQPIMEGEFRHRL